MSALIHYASTNNGNFPNKSQNGFASLGLLYPDYIDGELAGLSGDRSAAVRRLEEGRNLDEGICSWIHVPGLRTDDDGETAMVWERTGNVGVNGRRLNGHVVGFVDGSVRVIESQLWIEFLEAQATLLENALGARE